MLSNFIIINNINNNGIKNKKIYQFIIEIIIYIEIMIVIVVVVAAAAAAKFQYKNIL